MAKKNYYAVRTGYDFDKNEVIKNKIFDNWNIVKPCVTGFSKKSHGISPDYKGFETHEEALEYLDNPPFVLKKEGNYDMEAIHCYVDGSILKDGSFYSYGVVMVKNGEIIHTIRGKDNNPDILPERQIGGELKGAMLSLWFAGNHKFDDVVILFDYKGVACHALGTWDRNTKASKLYYKWMQEFFENNKHMNITFCKVDAHTGDEFNEIADGLAKSALGITPDDISLQYAKKHNILEKLEVM